jgi:hypothetical protein
MKNIPPVIAWLHAGKKQVCHSLAKKAGCNGWPLELEKYDQPLILLSDHIAVLASIRGPATSLDLEQASNALRGDLMIIKMRDEEGYDAEVERIALIAVNAMRDAILVSVQELAPA